MESSSTAKLDSLYEFDREPVSQDRLLGFGYFAGSFAGEHVAATEFVIGALFVNWGASVLDIFLGLAIGNLLAVLAWAFLCAPIAVNTRLTLYWYLRRIGGPVMTLIYNVINAILFSVLAGCMITVSASAVRVPFGIPAQVDWYPTDWRFILIVLLIGAVVVTLATLGFKSLAAFSSVCAPWMFLMFIGGAVVMIPTLAATAHVADPFTLAGLQQICAVVWTGQTPDGSPPVGFGKVAAFAAIANLAMHAGLSDMALFRYAKKSSYGFASIFGMFLGHYLAWICAGIMGAGSAILLATPLPQLDPGAVAYRALGFSGILAVVIAGWTTSNPTLYRAGLALQAITPNWSRTKVTVVTGILTTIIACFPFVFTKLLDFVGLYGLLLSPAGVIVLTEHYLFPRLGLPRYWATASGKSLNLPALISWAVAVVVALVLESNGLLHLFYLFVPTAVLTSLLYIVMVKIVNPPAMPEAPLPAASSAKHSLSLSEAPVVPSALSRLAGLVALLALGACLYLTAAVAFGQALDSIPGPLLAATMLYLACGTIYYRAQSR